MEKHEGHRERLRKRFESEGLDGFEDTKILEMLLFYVIPRRDTAPIAKALLTQFGTLPGVLEASREALAQVPGVGDSAASFIHFIMAVNRSYHISRASRRKALTTVSQCGEYLAPRFMGCQEELICVLCLDARCRVKGCKMLSQGTVDSAAVPIRKIVEFALSVNAVSVVLAHNHPGGIALPSQEDIESTKQVAAALDSVGVLLADHLIISADDYTSLAESGLLKGLGK